MKKTLIAAAAILASALLFISCGAKTPTEWTTDYNAAIEAAKAADGYVLLYVSGNDSDGLCVRLMNDVLSQPTFLKAAKGFTPVNLEVVTDESADEERQNEILEIGARLGLQYYPSIICLTPDERIFADIFFDPDSGTLESMTADMKAAAETGKKVTKLMKQIEKASGVKKAELIHELLSNVPEEYFNLYIDYAMEMPELDPENKTGVVGTYKMLFAYNEAIGYLFSGDIESAVAIYDTLAEDAFLTADDKQQCYFYAASLWYYVEDWEHCFEYLQKSVDAAPDSENADRIADQLKMLQINYEMSLEMAQEGEMY